MSSIRSTCSASALPGVMPLGSEEYDKDTIQKMPLLFGVSQVARLVVRLIFQYLGRKDQRTMTRVCRQARELVLKKYVFATEFPKPMWDALIWRALRTDTCSDNITLRDDSSIFRINTGDFIQIVGLWHHVLAAKNRDASLGSSAIMPAENGKENYEQLIKKFSANLLENIYQAITAMQRDCDKAKAYLELVKACIERKELEKAHSIILNMPIGLEKAKACLELVKACIERKELEKADSIILNMPIGLEKEKAYLELVKDCIERKELEKAHSIILNMPIGLEKAKAYLELVKACIERKELEKARAVAAKMESGFYKAKAYLELVKACIESKEFEQARAFIAVMQNGSEKVIAMIELTEATQKEETFKQVGAIVAGMPIGLEKEKTYLELVKACIKRLKFEQARAIITRMEPGFYKAKASLELAKIMQLQSGRHLCAEWDAAGAIINAMPDHSGKALLQQELAEGTRRRDDWGTLRAIISRMPDDCHKGMALTQLAQATQQKVDRDAAKILVDAITSSSTNARIMTEYEIKEAIIKEAIIKSDNFEAARVIIANMERGRNQALAQLELAKAFISIGNLYKACAAIDAIRDDYCKVVANIELWKALEDKGKALFNW